MNQQPRPRPPLLDVSDHVQDFYDRYPYPPPVEDLEAYRRAWRDEQKRRADYHLFWPGKSYREDFSILIAGCGTSQAAKHALRWPAAQVTGIDVSATSVQCTEELKRKHELANLRVHQLPIDRVSDLKESYDQIVCTGVLHHLQDPDGALAALRRQLKPEGAMHLMVYAPYGRTAIYIFQEFCRRSGISATKEGLTDLIAALRELPPDHPLKEQLRDALDVRNAAALADALLHPYDRAYSVPQLFDFIERAQLVFGRWIKQAPYWPDCGAMAHLPMVSRVGELSLVEKYAIAELFRGTMTRHSAVLYRDDASVASQTIDFEGEAWLRYLPIRMSETIVVQERLPPGAVAVVINRNHSDTDLVMTLDATEKRLFDAIDGNLGIGDILEKTLPCSWSKPELELARSLFERLWWHDQVVFDASRL